MTRGTVELPILVYSEDGKYVAHSLLTGTVSVRETPEEAMGEVTDLLEGELRDAIERAGNFEEAFESLRSTPPAWMVHAFFVDARDLAQREIRPEPKRRGKRAAREHLPILSFPVRHYLSSPPVPAA